MAGAAACAGQRLDNSVHGLAVLSSPAYTYRSKGPAVIVVCPTSMRYRPDRACSTAPRIRRRSASLACSNVTGIDRTVAIDRRSLGPTARSLFRAANRHEVRNVPVSGVARIRGALSATGRTRFSPPDPLQEKIARLLTKGRVVTIDKGSRTPPLELPIAKWLRAMLRSEHPNPCWKRRPGTYRNGCRTTTSTSARGPHPRRQMDCPAEGRGEGASQGEDAAAGPLGHRLDAFRGDTHCDRHRQQSISGGSVDAANSRENERKATSLPYIPPQGHATRPQVLD